MHLTHLVLAIVFVLVTTVDAIKATDSTSENSTTTAYSSDPRRELSERTAALEERGRRGRGGGRGGGGGTITQTGTHTGLGFMHPYDMPYLKKAFKRFSARVKWIFGI